MYEKIHQWLRTDKASYVEGYELLKQYGDCSNFLLSMLEQEDNWNRIQITEKLKELAKTVEKSLEIEERYIRAKEIVKEVRQKPSDAINAPAEVKELVNAIKKLYNEGKKLHARLELYEDDEKRFVAAERIIEIRVELKKLWSIRNFYDDHQRMPEQVQPSEMVWETLDDVNLNKEWLKHYKYLHRFKNDEQKATQLIERITLAHHIKEILIERNAFQYQDLTIPNISSSTAK
jgi:hypothetical protein